MRLHKLDLVKLLSLKNFEYQLKKKTFFGFKSLFQSFKYL